MQRGRRGFYDVHQSTGRIPKDSQVGGLGNDLNKQLRLFGGYVRSCIERYPGNVSCRMCEALNEALANRIARIDEDDGNRSGRVFGRLATFAGGAVKNSCSPPIVAARANQSVDLLFNELRATNFSCSQICNEISKACSGLRPSLAILARSSSWRRGWRGECQHGSWC